ncbi:MAG: acyl-CoA dehydrogenase, partial [Halospina sp.]
MDLLIVVLLALAGLLFVLRRESGAAAAITVMVVVGIIGLFMGTGWFSLLLFIGAGITAFAGLPGLRRQWLTPRAFALFKKVAPKVSETEKQALDAGTVGWDGELFTGRPDWHRLLTNRNTGLSQEEQAFV